MLISRSKYIATKHRAAFTIVELLIVVVIIGILASITLVTYTNISSQAKDSIRVSDIDSLNKSINIAYLNGASIGASNTLYISLPDSASDCSNLSLPALPVGWSYACSNSANYKNSDGTGWLPINLSSQLNNLPVDPTNSPENGNYYTYNTNSSADKFILTTLTQAYSQKAGQTSVNIIDNFPAVIASGSDTTISPIYNNDDIIGYWPLDGSPDDASGNGNNGNIVGALTNGSYYTDGKIGSAAIFNGIDNMMSLPNTATAPADSDLTVIAWVNLFSIPDTRFIGRWYGSSDWSRSGSLLLNSTSGYHFYVKNDVPATANAISNVDTVNQWVHLAGTWNQTTGQVAIFVNGTPSYSSLSGPSSSSTSGPGIMNSLDSGNKFIPGMVDELRAYRRALSQAEIVALYQSQK
jgi:prepilin-type N-terminal cleavage/methylation domain-containing protein